MGTIQTLKRSNWFGGPIFTWRPQDRYILSNYFKRLLNKHFMTGSPPICPLKY